MENCLQNEPVMDLLQRILIKPRINVTKNNILIIPTRFRNIRGMFFKEVGNTQRKLSDTLTMCTCIVQLLVRLVICYISTLHNYARLCLSFKILLHANIQPVVNYCTCGDSFSWRKYEESIKIYQLIFITF